MLEPIAEGVWGLAGQARMPGGVVFPLRATVVRLADGLWIHSPVALDEEAAAAIEAIGPVRHLVAPSRMHDLFAGAAKARWPEATLWGPAALAGTLPLDRHLEAGPCFGGALMAVPIEGAPKLDEVCFVHHPSRSVLVTDLVFHVLTAPNLATSLLLRLVGCHGRLGASRSWGWVFAADKRAVGRSVEALLAHDFDRLIPCHGDVVHSGAHEALEQATVALRAWAG